LIERVTEACEDGIVVPGPLDEILREREVAHLGFIWKLNVGVPSCFLAKDGNPYGDVGLLPWQMPVGAVKQASGSKYSQLPGTDVQSAGIEETNLVAICCTVASTAQEARAPVSAASARTAARVRWRVFISKLRGMRILWGSGGAEVAGGGATTPPQRRLPVAPRFTCW
jgi:hypothetical protein